MGQCCSTPQPTTLKVPDIDLFSGNKRLISAEDVRVAVRAALKHDPSAENGNTPCDPQITLLDGQYVAVDVDLFQKFFKANNTEQLHYTLERADCDDFADVFLGDIKRCVFLHADTSIAAGIAVGRVVGTIAREPGDDALAHVMNIVLIVQSGEMRVVLFEPQRDKIYQPNTKSTYWTVTF